jgi:hypothetical protein
MTTSKVHPKRQIIDDEADLRELEVLCVDGFDEAILGFVDIGERTVLAYSKTKILEQLVAGGCSWEDAQEHFSFNIEGSCVGATGPVFVEDDI